jgi:hypothetical protein
MAESKPGDPHYWQDKYFREVHGQNSEGDLIGGVPNGLLHELLELRAENERLRAELDQDDLVKFIAEKGLLLEYLLRTREARLKNYPGTLDPPKS